MLKNQTTPEDNRINKIMSVENILFDLWERDRVDFSEEELEWFSRASEHAGMLAKDLGEVLEGLGCLIMDDEMRREKGEPCVGIFQGNRVPAILFLVTKNLDVMQGLIQVGDSAAYRLTQLHKNQIDE